MRKVTKFKSYIVTTLLSIASVNAQITVTPPGGGGGSGTVTSVAVTTGNGVSGSVANPTTTPAITLTLGAITPTTVNGNTFTTGSFTLTGGAGKTFTFNNTMTFAGTDAQIYTFPTTSATIARTDAAQTFTGNNAIQVVAPVGANDATTKNYVDNALAAFQPLESVYAASTANIVGTYLNGAAGIGATFTVTATGALSMDSVSPPLNSRVLLKDQTTGFQNGVYTVTVVGTTGVSPVLTRSLDYNTPAEINAGDLIPVVNGTVNAVTSWLETAVITTIGTDALVFTKYSANPSSYLSITGGTLTGNLLFTDATYDIGASGATRPRDLFLSRNETVGGTLSVTGHVTLEGVTSTGASGTGSLLFGTLPRITTGINDSNGNSMLAFTATASAVDGFTITNAATANPAFVTLAATGTDTNISYRISAKGTGDFNIQDGGAIDSTSAYMSSSGHNLYIETGSTTINFRTSNGTLAANLSGTAGVMNFNFGSSSDVGIGRNAAGILEVNNGTAGVFAALKAGVFTLSPVARTSGTTSYFTLNIPADTAQTAGTESIGFQTVTASRQWATTGTVALQRENFFAGPTYTSASASQTFTDAFTLYATPPIAGSNAIFTRGHTFGIVDATNASSATTGGFIVATTLGTAAGSVGIGGGKVNAGTLVTAPALVGTTQTGIANFNQAAQSQVVVSATEYYITRSDLDMPATYSTAIAAGTTMHWRIALTKTAAGTGTFQILLKKGTAGSTADTSIVTQTIGTQTAAVDNMECDISLTWTSATAAYWTMIPRQSAASGTGFGLVYPATAAQFSGTITGQTTTTASDKYGLSVIFTTGTPTFVVNEVAAQAFGVN